MARFRRKRGKRRNSSNLTFFFWGGTIGFRLERGKGGRGEDSSRGNDALEYFEMGEGDLTKKGKRRGGKDSHNWAHRRREKNLDRTREEVRHQVAREEKKRAEHVIAKGWERVFIPHFYREKEKDETVFWQYKGGKKEKKIGEKGGLFAVSPRGRRMFMCRILNRKKGTCCLVGIPRGGGGGRWGASP